MDNVPYLGVLLTGLGSYTLARGDPVLSVLLFYFGAEDVAKARSDEDKILPLLRYTCNGIKGNLHIIPKLVKKMWNGEQ